MGSRIAGCKESWLDPKLQYACASKPTGKAVSGCAPVCRLAHRGAFTETWDLVRDNAKRNSYLQDCVANCIFNILYTK